jgi:hypothetical protein
MSANIRCRYAKLELLPRSVPARIAAFLDGTTNGEELFRALYDHVLNEPVPQSMRSILQDTERNAG